jgi:hypothetical protein
VSDPWEDEGFGGEDDWAGDTSLAADLEDDALSGLDELDEAEVEGEDDPEDDTLADEDE